MIIYQHKEQRFLDGTPMVHIDRANNRTGYVFTTNKHGYSEQQIVWLDDKGRGVNTSGIGGIVGIRYQREAEAAGVQPVTDAKLAELVAQAEQTMLDAYNKRKEAQKKAEQDHQAFLAEVAKLMPQDAKAVIVANYMIDQSDTMSDYFHSQSTRTLILAWSKHTRDLFSEMRKAALNAEECKHLFDAPPEAEHREKYSMGGGYYLKEDYRHCNGWKISKQVLDWGKTLAPFDERLQRVPAGELRLKQERPTEKREKPAIAEGFEVKEGTRPGFTEIHFASKPAEDVREELKGAGFRWSRANACWYGKTDKLPAKYK